MCKKAEQTMVTQNHTETLLDIQEKLHLEVLLHLQTSDGDTPITQAEVGSIQLATSLLRSNFLAVLNADIAMPIRVANEIYEMIIKNERGLVAKEGKISRYLVALKLDANNVLVAIGDDLDPGMVLYELLQFFK